MLILLPPSETKRAGGAEGTVLDLAQLSHPTLAAPRRAVLSAVRKLSQNLTTMSAALKLGPSQHFELLRNRELRASPTLAAIDRYTGVLYDALDSPTLTVVAREFATGRLLIHSALFGLLGAADPIPAYRLSHDSRLPELSLRQSWRAPISGALGAHEGLILDLRSEAYVDLGPLPEGSNAFYLRVVSEGPDGRKRALNHFNKKGKGAFARRILEAGVDHDSVDTLLVWAAGAGLALTRRGDTELELVVD